MASEKERVLAEFERQTGVKVTISEFNGLVDATAQIIKESFVPEFGGWFIRRSPQVSQIVSDNKIRPTLSKLGISVDEVAKHAEITGAWIHKNFPSAIKPHVYGKVFAHSPKFDFGIRLAGGPTSR